MLLCTRMAFPHTTMTQKSIKWSATLGFRTCQLLTCMVFIYDFSVSVMVSSDSPQTGRPGPALHVSNYHGEKIKKNVLYFTPNNFTLYYGYTYCRGLTTCFELFKASLFFMSFICAPIALTILFIWASFRRKASSSTSFSKKDVQCSVANWHNHINQDYTDYIQLIKYKYKTHSGKANFAEPPIYVTGFGKTLRMGSVRNARF